MYTTEVMNITKSFGSRRIVENVSFGLADHEIFGLIGPNGAGKTTCIRMIMDIVKPDSGAVTVLGEKFSDALKDRIGYLPEERGLYRKAPILETMTYRARLKGLRADEAKRRSEYLIERVNMGAHRAKKMEELSHGMGQIIQFLVAIVHNPEVIILDEPFNGLDPVNVQLVKDVIFDLKKQGKSIVLSTHRMNEVEALCDRVFMIHKGRNVLFGSIPEIKSRFSQNSMVATFEEEIDQIGGLKTRKIGPRRLEITPENDLGRLEILDQIVSLRLPIESFEVAAPSLNDIFIKVAGEEK